MKLCNIIIHCLLLCLVLGGDALAAQKALFLLSDLRQSLDLTYRYNGHSSESSGVTNTSSSSHRFDERYNFYGKYALLDPRILNGHFTLRLKTDQDFYSSTNQSSNSSFGTGFLYDINGIFYDRKPTPVNFYSRSELEHAQPAFNPGYDISSTANGLALSGRNKTLPFRLEYKRFTVETDGLRDDYKRTSDFFDIKANHDYENRSLTELEVTWTDERTVFDSDDPTDREKASEFRGNNTLYSVDKKRSLLSLLKYREETATFATFQNMYWQESFNWRLGKALNAGLVYNNSQNDYKSKTTGLENSQDTQTGNLWLSHQLFKSLTSRFNLTARQTDFDNGQEKQYAGSVDFTYRKNLPQRSLLEVFYSQTEIETDRNLNGDSILVIDEPLIADPLGENLLANPNVILDTIIVRDAINRSIIYDEGLDYNILQFGEFTGFDFAIAGSQILDGQALLITYSYLTNPDIKYSTSVHRIGSSITLYDRLLKFYGSFEQSKQDLISGSADTVGLNNENRYTLGFVTEIKNLSSGVEYINKTSTYDEYQSVNGFLRMSRYYRKGYFRLQARDLYKMNGGNSYSSSNDTENTFSLNSGYTRAIGEFSRVDLNATYVNVSSQLDRDDVMLELKYLFAYGKSELQFKARTQWRIYADSTIRDDFVFLRVVRYF